MPKGCEWTISLQKEAEAEALVQFPTIHVIYDETHGETPDWPATLRELNVYLSKTTDHRVAQAWWSRHTSLVDLISRIAEVEPGVSGRDAAAEFKAALFARFPQLAD